MRLPSFLIIGAAKAGTTSLFNYLCKHPQVYIPPRKEIDFFAVDQYYELGMDWYLSHFFDARPEQICGEASTCYSRLDQYPKTLERMRPVLKDPKFIYIMRHPVDRAYSFYIHRFKGAKHKPELAVPNTFEEAISVNNEFIDSSNYIAQIERYLEYYNRDSFLFLLLEDLASDPSKVLGRIFRFIGVDDEIDVVGNRSIVANKKNDFPDWYVQKKLLEPIKSLPMMSQAARLLPPSLRQNISGGFYRFLKKYQYKQWLENQRLPPPMRGETRQMLIKHFEKPNRRLSDFLGRDLSHWSK